MAILSLLAGKLVVPIVYEFKTKELFEDLGFEKLLVDIEGVTEGYLIEKVKYLLECNGDQKSRINFNLKRMHTSAMEPFAFMKKYY